MFYIGLSRENMNKSFLEPQGLAHGMKHHLVNLSIVRSNMPPGAKVVPPGGHMFYIGKQKITLLFRKKQGLERVCLVCNIA